MRNALLIVVLSLIGVSARAETNRAGLDFFETKIRPVLVEECYSCHAETKGKKKTKGGLALDTRAGVLRGGESGQIIVPGKPKESLLIRALRHESPKMPPKKKLSDSVVADFAKWVEMGAPDPRVAGAAKPAAKTGGDEVDIVAAKKFWSMAPLGSHALPAVKDGKWVRNSIDRFIRARQERAGVRPSARADLRMLVRRIYHSLIGLPPEPEVVEKFVADATKDFDQAYDALVDRLLADSGYGERWARHWLDLARFAESNGYAFDGDRPNAYHYRDFVIRAWNDDIPYDEFVKLQIAGDLLRPGDLDAIAATGFVVAGPYTTQQTMKERERSRYEQLDDIVHTIGTSMLGLTIGCARCHTHKYDPVPVHDYYEMVSCFKEVGFTNAGIPQDPKEFQQKKAAFDADLAKLVAMRAEYEKEELHGKFVAWHKNRPEQVGPPFFGPWYHAGPFPSANFDKAFDEKFAPEDGVDLQAKYLDGKIKWTKQEGWKDGNVYNPFNAANASNYLYRVVESSGVQKILLSLGRDDAIRVRVNGVEVHAKKAPGGAAANQDQVEIGLRKGRNEILVKITNASGPSGFYFKPSSAGPPPDVLAIFKLPIDKLTAEQRTKAHGWYRTIDEGWKKLDGQVREFQSKEPKPAVTNVFSARVRGSTYGFGGDTYKVYHLARGNPANKRGEAAPGFLRVLMKGETKASHWLAAEEKEKAPSQRVALANWLTDQDAGAGHLLARVIVNRLWFQHFGRGIVMTPSDFGTRGERPSHPELLDWLASELIRGDWKLKPIQRTIVTSATYLQSCEGSEDRKKIDPDNRLFWRREPRRHDAETLRDALLAVSGSLDRTAFGKGSLDERNARRSVYLTVKRSRLIPFLQLFDAPDTMQSVGQRQESTVAPQALAMLNSPFVRSLATKLANRLEAGGAKTPEALVDAAYRHAFARPPSADEESSMVAFVSGQTKMYGGDAAAAKKAAYDFCHVVLCMNEFIYID